MKFRSLPLVIVSIVLATVAYAGSENYQGTIPYDATGGSTTRTPADRANDHGINIKEFGAIGDGSSHPLSSIYGSLAAAQAVYPFVDDLLEEVDWAATQAAIDYAYSTQQQVTYCPGVTAPNASYQLNLPIFIDKPGNFRGSSAKWAVGTTYALGAAVKWNGVPWTSLGAGNIGAPPTLQPLQNADGNRSSVTISNASPAIVTWTGPSLPAGMPFILYPSASDGTAHDPVVPGTLPTGVSAATVYYLLATGLTSTSGQFSATPGGAAINTSSTYTGTPTLDNQVWALTPVIGTSFGDQSTFVGQEGLSSSVGCRFFAQFGNGTAFYIGPNNGNLIKNVQVYHLNYTVGYPRCGWNSNSVGFGELGNGGGASRTKLENVGADGFYTGFMTGDYSTGALDDSNTVIKSSLGGGCYGVWISQTQNFINSFYDSNLGGVNALLSNVNGGANVWGGNTSFIGDNAAFAITSTSSTDAAAHTYLQATITTPDGYLTNTYCVQYLRCHYSAWTALTTHFGVVPLKLIGFNPITSVAQFEVDPRWQQYPYGNTCCSGLGTDLAAVSKIYADEMATTFSGGGIDVRGVHVENPGTAVTLLDSTIGFGANRPSRLTDVYGNSNFPNGDEICCYQNPSLAPSDEALAAFYASQSFPFLIQGGPIIIDGFSGGGNNKAFDRLLYSYDFSGSSIPVSTPLVWRNGQSSDVKLNFRGTSNGSQLPFSGGVGTQTFQSLCTAGLGCGEYDNPAMVLSGGAEHIANYADYWKMARGSSPMTGVHPSYGSAGPCVTPAQVTTLSGTLPAITYTSALQYSRTITSGGAGTSAGYTAADVLTLVGGTFSTAAQIKVDTVDGGGGILTWHITNSGTYTVESATFTVTGGTGTGAAFATPGWIVAYDVSYPLMYGGTQYRLCDWNLGTQTHYGLVSSHFGWSYGQDLTTTNVPNLSWSATGSSPIVYVNYEAIQLLFPGINMTLTATGGAAGCSGQSHSLMITGIYPTLGYVTVLNSAQDGSPFLAAWGGGGGDTCTGTTIGQAAYSLTNLN